MNDLISVIVPVYNTEKYLRKCIESILSQSYKNIELLLINDGSTDSSAEICREYLDKDKRCYYLEDCLMQGIMVLNERQENI